MREDYEIQGPTTSLTVDVETEVSAKLTEMSQHTELSPSQLVNTALKRFISQHKDFLPRDLKSG